MYFTQLDDGDVCTCTIVPICWFGQLQLETLGRQCSLMPNDQEANQELIDELLTGLEGQDPQGGLHGLVRANLACNLLLRLVKMKTVRVDHNSDIPSPDS